MNIDVHEKIVVSLDFAKYKYNNVQTISDGVNTFTGNILCKGNGFIQIIGSGDRFAVLTHIDFSKTEDNFEYTIISFKEIEWLRYYIEALSRIKADTLEIIYAFEQHLHEVKDCFLGLNGKNSSFANIEGNYKFSGAFQKYDAEIYKAIKIDNNLDSNIKSKLKIISLMLAYYAKSKLTHLSDFFHYNEKYMLIGLGKPIPRRR